MIISQPSVALTKNGPVTYTVTYTDATVITLSADDVTLNATGTATGTVSVQGSGATLRTVVLSEISGEGTLGITIAPGTAVDPLGNSAASAGPSATIAGVRGETGAVFPEFRNNIFQNNAIAVQAAAVALQGGGFDLYFNNIRNFEGPSLFSTDFAANPLFVDAPRFNFYLKFASPARNAGDPAVKFRDRDGSRNDVGADGGPFGVRDFQSPNAVIDVSATEGEAPLTVAFDGFRSSDEWGIYEYSWDFDAIDGIQRDAAGPVVEHTYQTHGGFVATLTVTDNSGNRRNETVDLLVKDGAFLPPTASASATPNAGPTPLTVQFEGTGADPDGGSVTFDWSFDDGSRSLEQNPQHTFVEGSAPRSYRIVLTVTDDEGAQSQTAVFVTITEDEEEDSTVVDTEEETVVSVDDETSPIFGASVTIPPGATTDTIVVTISQVSAVLPQFDEDVGLPIHFGPTGTIFSLPVVVRMPHPAETIHSEVLEVFWFDPVQAV